MTPRGWAVLGFFVLLVAGSITYSSLRLPRECPGATVGGNIDRIASAEGEPSVREAAATFLPSATDRVVTGRLGDRDWPGYVVRAYAGHDLLTILEIHRSGSGVGWSTYRTTRCLG